MIAFPCIFCGAAMPRTAIVGYANDWIVHEEQCSGTMAGSESDGTTAASASNEGCNTCTLSAIDAQGNKIKFDVRPITTVVKTKEGARLMINLCGPAQPKDGGGCVLEGTASAVDGISPVLEGAAAVVDKEGRVKGGARQLALAGTTPGSPALLRNGKDAMCHSFGSLPPGPMPPQPVMTLLSPHAPSRGITLHYEGGTICTRADSDDDDDGEADAEAASYGDDGEADAEAASDGDDGEADAEAASDGDDDTEPAEIAEKRVAEKHARARRLSEGKESRASTTFIVRCDYDANPSAPILKSVIVKDDCDLEVEIIALDGCPNPPWSGEAPLPGDGEEGEEGEASEMSQSADLCLGGTCTLEMLLDPQCNPECANDECYWDNGACYAVTMGCPGCVPEWLADGECDDECNTQQCNWDSGDCTTSDGRFVQPSRPRCLPSCPASWQGDGECDPACDTRACAYDNGDCAPGSCLLAVATPDMGHPAQSPAGRLDSAENSMGGGGGAKGVGMTAPGAAVSGMVAAVAGSGPPAVFESSTVWYDLSGFGVQRLTIPDVRARQT